IEHAIPPILTLSLHDALPISAARLPALLELRGEREEGQDLLAREVARGDEVPHALALASTVFKMPRARRTSADSTMSGGTSLTTFSPALRTRSPVSRQASTIGAAGVESSTPMRRPRPRTCLTTGHAG